jgi:hypothetical protein
MSQGYRHHVTSATTYPHQGYLGLTLYGQGGYTAR